MSNHIIPIRDRNQLQPGDLIGFSGHGWLSNSINIATYGIPHWGLSHVGIIGSYNGRLLLFESTTLNELPCEITGKPIKGSQAHDLDTRVASYRGRVWHYPLYRTLYDHEAQRLNEFLVDTIARPYADIDCFRCIGVGWSFVESLLHEANLASLFCSEWCAAAHSNIGVLPTANVARWNPNRLARYERHNGILLPPRRLK